MGRPREHDESTARALLDSAEKIISADGVEAVTVRRAADTAGTTVRAVYSLFGSKDGLISALVARAYDFLADEIEKLPYTADPAADLLDVAVEVYRTLVVTHPSLFRVAFQRISELKVTEDARAARGRAMVQVSNRLQRMKDAGLLGEKSVLQAGMEFTVMCEGLANTELRGRPHRLMPKGREAAAWRAAVSTLLRGFRDSGPDYELTESPAS